MLEETLGAVENGSGPQKHVRNMSVIDPRSLSKTHENYWKTRVRKRAYKTGAVSIELPDFQVSLSFGGKQRWVRLDTASRLEAARKARDLYLKLRSGGWAAVTPAKPEKSERRSITVGEHLKAVQELGLLKPVTFEIYARKFRTLVAETAGVVSGAERFNHAGPGYSEWLGKVHKVRLASLTPDRIQRWKAKRLEATNTPAARKAAATTVHSILRGSKALFRPRILRLLPHTLPAPLPFEGVENPAVRPSSYRSSVEAAALVVSAQRDLLNGPAEGRELFKILLLALFAGLRRDEIDTLTWDQIDFSKNTIRIETNEFTHAKSRGSEGEVDVDPALLEFLAEERRRRDPEFVIVSRVAPRPGNASYHHYRCNRLFNILIGWLRKQGIHQRNALHTLRKEFGSLVCQKFGIYAASEALRHSNIQLTRDYYLAKKERSALAIPVQLAPIENRECQGEPGQVA